MASVVALIMVGAKWSQLLHFLRREMVGAKASRFPTFHWRIVKTLSSSIFALLVSLWGSLLSIKFLWEITHPIQTGKQIRIFWTCKPNMTIRQTLYGCYKPPTNLFQKLNSIYFSPLKYIYLVQSTVCKSMHLFSFLQKPCLMRQKQCTYPLSFWILA